MGQNVNLKVEKFCHVNKSNLKNTYDQTLFICRPITDSFKGSKIYIYRIKLNIFYAQVSSIR